MTLQYKEECHLYMSNNQESQENIIKKGVHFNLNNDEDRIIIDYLKLNNINFSALTKQLMMQYIHEQILTTTQVERIAREVTNEIIESKLTDEGLQNQIRKVLLSTFPNIDIKALSSSVDKKENIIDKALGSYTQEDKDAMNFK